MELEFESGKSVSRTFYCSNKLWVEMIKKTDDILAISSYIKKAIIEKMIKEDPKNREYYETLF